MIKLDVFRSEKLGTLTGENEQAAVDLRETQERFRYEWEETILPQEGRLLGDQTGGGTRRVEVTACRVADPLR